MKRSITGLCVSVAVLALSSGAMAAGAKKDSGKDSGKCVDASGVSVDTVKKEADCQAPNVWQKAEHKGGKKGASKPKTP